MASTVSLVFAQGVLTMTGVVVDTNTVVIGGKTYTFQTSLTDVDGNILIGADQTASMVNLVRAITLGAGSGTLYAASMTANTHVRVATSAAAVCTITAQFPGVHGNLIDSTETLANGSFAAAVFASGSGGFGAYIDSLLLLGQLNADVEQDLRANATDSVSD